MCPPQLPNNMSYKTSGEFLSHSSALAVTDSYDKPFDFGFDSTSHSLTHPPLQKRPAVLLSDPSGAVGPRLLALFFSSTFLFLFAFLLKWVYSPSLALLTWHKINRKEIFHFSLSFPDIV